MSSSKQNQANQAVVKLLAKWFGMPKTSLELLLESRYWHTSIEIYGKNDEILKLLETLVK